MNKVWSYKYIPDTLLENENYKVHWDRDVMTDKIISYQVNIPDVISNIIV
jgi:hypothetical protein